MKTTSSFIAVALGALGLACASTQTKQQTTSGNVAATTANPNAKDATASDSKGSGKVVCTYETPVGSHIPEKRCFYQEDIDAVRRETIDQIIQHTNAGVVKGGG
jgi:hypothetical protein